MSPGPVAGQLLGMGRGEVLEITDMFPFATRAADEEDEATYQVDMMKALRDVNVDHTSVGWYQTTSLDAPIQASFIEAQAGYQIEIPNSCFLVYDQMRSCQGPPSVRAFRLSDDFISALKSNRRPSSAEFEDFLKADGIFVELSVEISLSAMDRMMLASWAEELPAANVLGSENAHKLLVARLAQNMVVALDESISEAARVQHYVRVVGKQCQTISIQKQKRVSVHLHFPIRHLILNFRRLKMPSDNKMERLHCQRMICL